MDQSLHSFLAQLRAATTPEEVFGPLPGDQPAALKQRYRALVAQFHPDLHPKHPAEAHEAFKTLQHWYAAAQAKVDNGVYGTTPRITVSGTHHQYVGYEPPLTGDLCDLFPANADGERVLLKVARQPRNNDLLQQEARLVQRIARELDGKPVRAHFPTLIEPFVLRDATNVDRHINVLRAEPETYSLAEVVNAYPQGLHPADAAWMFRRLIAALGIVHGMGFVHGAVILPHVLIRPSDHNGILIDWCYSVAIDQPIKALSSPYKDDYPPEVPARQPAGPATDLYMAARVLLHLLGGKTGTKDLPPSVPKPIRTLLDACLIPTPQRRVDDAWQLFDDFQDILHALYGPPKFRPFKLN